MIDDAQADAPESAQLVQLVLRKAENRRVQRGTQPVFEFDLFPHERIVGVEHYFTRDYHSRSTVDHYISVWIAVDLKAPDA